MKISELGPVSRVYAIRASERLESRHNIGQRCQQRGVVVFDECCRILRLGRCTHIHNHDAIIPKVFCINDCAPDALASVDTTEKQCIVRIPACRRIASRLDSKTPVRRCLSTTMSVSRSTVSSCQISASASPAAGGNVPRGPRLDPPG
eukprot:COSAG02_NODE_111_length_36009_cov_42.221248_16_plen_148_part_00